MVEVEGLEKRDRETRRRLDSFPASLRPYIVFSIRKSMYGFPALSCFRKGRREGRDRTARGRVDFNKFGSEERGPKIEIGKIDRTEKSVG